MNNRTQELLKRAKKAQTSSNETLKRTTPKATLGGIKQAAEKKFGSRKSKKQIQPKKNQPKKQPKPKAISSDKLDQWKKAMEKSGIPKHRWKKLEDKISRITGPKRKEIEDALFEHDMFKAVYSVGEDDPELTDEYLSDLEEKVNEVIDENIILNDLIDNLMETNPNSAISAAIIKGAITKIDLTNALTVMSNETGVESGELIKFSMYNTDDYDFATKGKGAVPFKDFELNKNAIQNAYGIDTSTKEGMEKFEDLTIFKAMEAANKQKQMEEAAKQIESKKQIEMKNNKKD